MEGTFDFRLAADHDLTALADLRWRLQTDDLPISNQVEYERFIQDFVGLGLSEPRTGELFHWVASVEDRVVAAMSVVLVRKVPKPGRFRGRWGYLTNCYVLPEMRNRGVGASLLATIKSWAAELELELLVVWPSDRAYPFYGRAGFVRRPDPLVLEIAPG
ncbi:MAG: GNAT family N-acetyltransferase [Caulobacteraceae bacterium]